MAAALGIFRCNSRKSPYIVPYGAISNWTTRPYWLTSQNWGTIPDQVSPRGAFAARRSHSGMRRSSVNFLSHTEWRSSKTATGPLTELYSPVLAQVMILHITVAIATRFIDQILCSNWLFKLQWIDTFSEFWFRDDDRVSRSHFFRTARTTLHLRSSFPFSSTFSHPIPLTTTFAQLSICDEIKHFLF
jgi:hypothetical protein